MVIIGSAAFFKICACGKHGQIVFAGGETGSEDFCSKESALEAMNLKVKGGRITEHEIPGLRQQIMESSLTRYEQDVKGLARLSARIKNLCETPVPNLDLDEEETPHQQVH